MTRNLLLFSLCWMLPVDSMRISVSFTLQEQSVPLNMVEDAVDDMYIGCKHTMEKKVKNKYFPREKNTEDFKSAWNRKLIKKCVNRAKTNVQDPDLTDNHLQAICVYTSTYKTFYKTFNDAVRNNRSIYGTSFKYHSFHFWLTSALQILNNKKKCETTYRRTNLEFTGKVNQKMRFGFFASSSKLTTMFHFGHKTCFKIQTCFGAHLKNYTYLNDKEKEVLIPPYEMFRIAGKKKGRDVKELADCELVYVLKSVRVLSNLNCEAVK